MIDISTTALILLPLAATVAGFVDTLAGGGGLITVPALLLAGLPPLNALATNKVQGSIGTLTASVLLMRKGLLKPAQLKTPLLYCTLAAVLGTVLVQFLPAVWLSRIVPLVLLIIALYFLLAPNAGQIEARPRLQAHLYQRLVLPIIAFYDGLIGPGTGSFFCWAGVALRGQTLLTATAHAKAFNFMSNLASVAVFVLGGKVLWDIGLCMMLGQMLGAGLATVVMVNKGSMLIRPMIVAVCFIMLLRLWANA